MSASDPQRITLIGLGTIGMSMAALHLKRDNTIVDAFDTRPDIEEYLLKTLPNFLTNNSSDPSQAPTPTVSDLITSGRLHIHTTLASACASATVVQEQGPENLLFKQSIWSQVESLAPATTHFWTSTSGIAASAQQENMTDKTRLLVVHPFNPPHIMPLLEIVPSPTTAPERVEFAREYFSLPPGESRHRPVVIRKEIPGFVGNRLAFALLREACYLVQEDVVSVKDLDTILMASLGPRWAGNGVFESYQQGGGKGGIAAFLEKLGGTMQEVWAGLGQVNVLGSEGTEWKEKVIQQTDEAYGTLTKEGAWEKEERLRDFIRAQESSYGQ
ncbi:hypothetical protein BJX64DRAFT_299310 [Aspergillus heterothallicus]